MMRRFFVRSLLVTLMAATGAAFVPTTTRPTSAAVGPLMLFGAGKKSPAASSSSTAKASGGKCTKAPWKPAPGFPPKIGASPPSKAKNEKEGKDKVKATDGSAPSNKKNKFW